MTFSDRQGLGHTTLQIESMSDELRAGLWNAVTFSYRADIYANKITISVGRGSTPSSPYSARNYNPDSSLLAFAEKLVINVMRQPSSSVNPREAKLDKRKLLDTMKEWILKKPWYRVYDLIEFLPSNYPWTEEVNNGFRAAVNLILEREFAGYRFVSDKLVRITDKQEIQSIEESLKLDGPLTPASGHLRRALQLLSDRESPDYRNSIKESISAVEAACRVVSGKPKATLSDALKAVGDESAHPALRDAFSKLYAWTNDEGGVRHAMTGETSVSFADAQFMVVACSAFTNYLATKAASRSG